MWHTKNAFFREMQFLSHCYTVVSYQVLFRLSVYKIPAVYLSGAKNVCFCTIREFGSPTICLLCYCLFLFLWVTWLGLFSSVFCVSWSYPFIRECFRFVLICGFVIGLTIIHKTYRNPMCPSMGNITQL